MLHKVVQVRLYPTKEQQVLLAQTFGSARWWHLARDWVLILASHTSEKRVHQLHRERSFPLPVRVAPSHQLGLDSVRVGREHHYTLDFLEVSTQSDESLPNWNLFHQLLPSLLISLCQFRANTALATAALVQYLAGVA